MIASFLRPCDRRLPSRRVRSTIFLLALLGTSLPLPLLGQEPVPLPAEIQADLDARYEAIQSQAAIIRDLDARRRDADEELLRSIYSERMDGMWTDVFDATLKLARDVAKRRDAGFDVEQFAASLAADLKGFPDKAMAALDRINTEIQYPRGELEPTELVRRDQELLVALGNYDAALAALVDYTEIAGTLGIDASAVLGFLYETLPDNAANRSAYLGLALNRVAVNRSSATTLPDDVSLQARERAANARVKVASQALQETVRLMNKLDLDTRAYRQQILTATGEVTTDVLDVGIVKGLLLEWSKNAVEFTREEGPRLLFQLLLVALIVFIAARLGRLAKRLTHAALNRGKIQMSNLLQQMIVGSIGNIIFLIGLLIGLSQLGIALGPLLAGFGIVGFIVGFALQDTLSNFASGMMILMYRPFDVGDFVTAAGISGRVEKMSLVNTTFKTFDNQVMIVPNSDIWQSVITNLTAQETRRVDLTFNIAYDEDVAKAEAVIWKILNDYDKVLEDPEPTVRVHELGESFVKLIVRPWVRTEDYWPAYWHVTREVKDRFTEAGIAFPFPQRTVHVVQTDREDSTT
jgi:small conductance mechanosensitive channel